MPGKERNLPSLQSDADREAERELQARQTEVDYQRITAMELGKLVIWRQDIAAAERPHQYYAESLQRKTGRGLVKRGQGYGLLPPEYRQIIDGQVATDFLPFVQAVERVA